MLVLDRLGKTYPNGVHALGGVSLEVELGEIVAVIGGSGCGKSTLLRAIAGLDPATEGAVILDGAIHLAAGQTVGGGIGFDGQAPGFQRQQRGKQNESASCHPHGG